VLYRLADCRRTETAETPATQTTTTYSVVTATAEPPGPEIDQPSGEAGLLEGEFDTLMPIPTATPGMIR